MENNPDLTLVNPFGANHFNYISNEFRYHPHQEQALLFHGFDGLSGNNLHRNGVHSGLNIRKNTQFLALPNDNRIRVTHPLSDARAQTEPSTKKKKSLVKTNDDNSASAADHSFELNQEESGISDDLNCNIYSEDQEDEEGKIEDFIQGNNSFKRKRKRKMDVDATEIPVVRMIKKSNGQPLLTTTKPRKRSSAQNKAPGPSSPFFIFLKQEIPKAKEYLQSQTISNFVLPSIESSEQIHSPIKVVVNQKEVVKEAKRRWHQLDQAEKQIYYDQAKLQFQSISVSKKDIPPEIKRMRKRALQVERKNLNLPKRPRPGFLIYCADMRESVKKEYPLLKSFHIQEKLGELWRNLPFETKEHYEELCRKEKERFRLEMEEWKIHNASELNSNENQELSNLSSVAQSGNESVTFAAQMHE